MKEKSCKGCKRENSSNPIVIREFCGNCARRLCKSIKRGTDFYESRVNKI